MLDLKKTSFGEWSCSLNRLVSSLPNLDDLSIQLLNSSRCLKYHDDITEDKSINKVRRISVSNVQKNNACGFQLTHVSKFVSLSHLTLSDFVLSKDEFYQAKGSDKGRIDRLKSLHLTNCKWEYPSTLVEIFNPVYHCTPGLAQYDISNQIESLRIVYKNDESWFVTSERFRDLIANMNSEKVFPGSKSWLAKLKELDITIYDDKHAPHLHWLDLKKKLPEGQTILTNLRVLRLVGWKADQTSEILDFFRTSEGEYNLEVLELKFIKVRDNSFLERISGLLDKIFAGVSVSISVSFID